MRQLSEYSGAERMIQEQLLERGIHDERVLRAMRKVPRERFFPQNLRQQAHADRAAPIGHGQTISQPYIVALMTERLELLPEHRVLELGTGSGYHTAILAHLCAEVCTIERVKPLLDEAFERLMSLNIRNVHLRYADGTEGWPEKGPFDRIIITAGAPQLPRELLLANLVDKGIAVLPVGEQDNQMLVQVTRTGNDLISKDLCACRFVKLIGKEGWGEQ